MGRLQKDALPTKVKVLVWSNKLVPTNCCRKEVITRHYPAFCVVIPLVPLSDQEPLDRLFTKGKMMASETGQDKGGQRGRGYSLDETSNSYSKYGVENSFLLFWNWTTHWCFKIMLLSTNLLKKKNCGVTFKERENKLRQRGISNAQ